MQTPSNFSSPYTWTLEYYYSSRLIHIAREHFEVRNILSLGWRIYECCSIIYSCVIFFSSEKEDGICMWLAVPWLGFALLSILCHGTRFVFSPLLSSLSLQCYDGRLVCGPKHVQNQRWTQKSQKPHVLG